MPDLTVHGERGDVLRILHDDGGMTVVVWLDGGEAIVALEPYVVKALRDRRRWPRPRASPSNPRP